MEKDTKQQHTLCHKFAILNWVTAWQGTRRQAFLINRWSFSSQESYKFWPWENKTNIFLQ